MCGGPRKGLECLPDAQSALLYTYCQNPQCFAVQEPSGGYYPSPTTPGTPTPYHPAPDAEPPALAPEVNA